MAKELKSCFITETMFCSLAFIDLIMASFFHIFNNLQVKIQVQGRELAIMLIFVGICNRNLRDIYLQNSRAVVMSSTIMLLKKS